METDDQRLVAACKAGDMSAFEALFHRYERQVYRLAYRMLADPESAQDIAQDTFLKAFTSLHMFRRHSSFPAWLTRIAANRCLDEMDKRRRRCRCEADEPHVLGLVTTPEASSPHAVAEFAELSAQVRGCLHGLPSDYRAIIVLRDLEGLSYKQMAEALGISIANVKARLHRARMALRTAVEAGMAQRPQPVPRPAPALATRQGGMGR